jgi:hypothetical protein
VPHQHVPHQEGGHLLLRLLTTALLYLNHDHGMRLLPSGWQSVGRVSMA